MKRTLCFLLLFCLCLTLIPPHTEAIGAGSLRLVVASDLHYLAPSLTDGGEAFQRILETGDSKFMPYIEEITDAFLAEVLKMHPDAVLLTGDLSFNGARISHEALAHKLSVLEEAGIPVLVLTGNHDVYNPNAARFYQNSFGRVPSATTESFGELYAAYGLNEALSVDTDSLSYLYPLGETLWVLMLDFNTAHDFCGVSQTTLAWIEQQLQAAQDAGVTVLAAGHQNLFRHSIFRGGYVIEGADALAALLRAYNVRLFLSGHLHIQHICEENSLTEIATSALCSYPCQYGIVVLDGDDWFYTAKRLNLSAWAAENRRGEPVFQDFAAAAGDYMDAHFTPSDMPPAVSDPKLWSDMLRYLQAVNRAYFSGDLQALEALDPDGSLASLWLQQGDMTALYLRSILEEAGCDFTRWSSRESTPGDQ